MVVEAVVSRLPWLRELRELRKLRGSAPESFAERREVRRESEAVAWRRRPDAARVAIGRAATASLCSLCGDEMMS